MQTAAVDVALQCQRVLFGQLPIQAQATAQCCLSVVNITTSGIQQAATVEILCVEAVMGVLANLPAESCAAGRERALHCRWEGRDPSYRK